MEETNIYRKGSYHHHHPPHHVMATINKCGGEK